MSERREKTRGKERHDGGIERVEDMDVRQGIFRAEHKPRVEDILTHDGQEGDEGPCGSSLTKAR